MRFYWGLALILALGSFIMPVWADDDEQPLLPANLQTITLENVHQLERLATIGLGRIEKIIFSPDGKYLAVNTKSTIYLYDMNDLSSPPRQIKGIDKIWYFSPDGKLLLSNNAVWDFATETLLYTFKGSKPFFTRDSAMLVLNHDTEPLILDALTGEVLDNPSLKDIGLALRDEIIYINRNGTIVEYQWGTWDEETGWTRPEIEQTDVFLGQHGGGREISPDGTLVAESSWQGFAIWNLETGKLILEQDSWLYPSLTAPFFSPDSRFLAVGEANGKLFVYDRVEDRVDDFYYDSSIRFIEFSPNSSVMAVITENGKIHIRSTETWERQIALDGFNPYPSMLYINEDETILSIIRHNAELWQWDLKTGDFLNYDSGIYFYSGRGTAPYASAVDMNPKSEIIASGSADEGIIRLRTWQGEDIINNDPGDNGLRTVESLDFSPDGTLLAGATSEGVRLFDAETLEVIASAEIRGEEITFSPDGQSIAVGTWRGEINILESDSLQPIRTIESVQNNINNMIFSPDGTKIAITYNCYRCGGKTDPEKDFTIWVYDVVTGDVIYHLALDNTHAVGSITFSQDGNMLIALMVDKLAFWDLTTGELFHSVDESGAFRHIMNETGTMIFNYDVDASVSVWGVRGD